MNCAEAVNPGDILWKSRENRSVTGTWQRQSPQDSIHKKQMRPRDQPSRSRIVRRLSRLPSRCLGQRDDGTGPTALSRLRAPHLPLRLRNRDSENHNSAAFAVADGPTQLVEQVVEEAAVPGQPAHACARFRFSPAIHPRESPVCRWRRRKHRSASLGKSHVFGEPTVRQIVSTRN
jgi:hypothetical protein